MDNEDKRLYYEENRKALLDLNKSVKELIKLTKEQYSTPEIKLPDNLDVKGKLEVNTEPVVCVDNLYEITSALGDLSFDLEKAIKDNSYKPVDIVTVKNIKEAKPDTVKVNNLKDLAQYFTTLGETIKANKPLVNVEKQVVEFPTSPNKPIAVRLSDGKSFYNAMFSAFSGGALSSFKDSNGNAKQVELTASGKVPIELTETISKQIESANDNITTINYTDGDKDTVSSIVQSSATVGYTVTKTFNNAGATTLVITRGVA